MHKMWFFVGGILVAVGCTGDDPQPTDDTDDGGACGEISRHAVSVVGLVQTEDGAPAVASNVRLEDRGWEPGTVLGDSLAGDDGSFRLENAEITNVENCWGTLLDYVLVAESGELYGEKEINQQLYNAILDGESTADVSAIPIVVD